MPDDYEPIEFDRDAYDDFSEKKRPGGRRILITLVAMVVLGGFAGFIAYAYTVGGKMTERDTPKIIKRAEGPFKKKPNSPGGMKIPHRDKSVYERLLADRRNERRKAKGERLLPPPEQPSHLLAPDKPAASRRGFSALSSAQVLPPVIEPPKTPPPLARAPINSMPSNTRRAAPIFGAEAARRGRPATSGAENFRVQLASLRTNGAVHRAWSRLQKNYPGLLGPLALSVVRMDLGMQRGIFYRMQAGPLNSADAARSLCGRLKARKQDCIIVER